MNKTLTLYGTGAILLMFGLLYSTYQQTDIDNWVALIERLGIPIIFLGGLLWMIWRGVNAAAPFIKERAEELTSFPSQQFKLEREERLEKQMRFEDIVTKITSDHNQTFKEISQQNATTYAALVVSISDLAKQIELLAKKVGEK